MRIGEIKDFTKIKEKGVVDCGQQMQPIHLLELFGGIGAPRRALENVIAELVKNSNPMANKRQLRALSADRIKSIDYVEVLPYAVQAYNQMFDLNNRPQDIRLWNMNVDILVHGSPCQDYSREGKNDLNTGRSILYERTLQILNPAPENGYPELTRRPKVVIWENVPNMAYSHPDVLRNYLTTMENYGYTNTFCGSKKYETKGGYVSPRSIMVDYMLDASDYGIPQARERFFCISVLNEYADRNGAFKMPEPVPENKRYTLKQFLDLSADMDSKENSFTETELSITKKVGSQWYVRQAVKGDFGAGPGYVPVNEYQRVDLAFPNSKNRRGRVGDYASTLTTSPRQGVLIKDKFRTFTAKEKLRLMGFRDRDYENMEKSGLTDKQISLLAGNSICVPVLENIFRAVILQYPEMFEKAIPYPWTPIPAASDAAS
ncbi:MAG: DNA cytosine methyltransferase [Lachnospiraceae bacterium]|nr:DNA cytosine methyltransferase [Lachnospiraceae bacterium]